MLYIFREFRGILRLLQIRVVLAINLYLRCLYNLGINVSYICCFFSCKLAPWSLSKRIKEAVGETVWYFGVRQCQRLTA